VNEHLEFEKEIGDERCDCLTRALAMYYYDSRAKNTCAVDAFASMLYPYPWMKMAVNNLDTLNFDGKGSTIDEMTEITLDGIYGCPLTTSVWRDFCLENAPEVSRLLKYSDVMVDCINFTIGF
jgi:hypothetical protein